ncbi:MAG: hypothetical protein H6739_04010 [Alphaproteobacteria bacterium]|nr:hypothetical protein [Alphaproteobacteria bacterium]
MPTPLLLLAALSVGCAPRTFPEDSLPEHEERPVIGTFNADFDTVWEATLQVMGDMAPLDDISKSDGLITTSWVTGFSDYIYKAYGGTRIPEPVRWRMDVTLNSNGGRTDVRVIGHEQVEKDMISANLEFTGAIYDWIDVPSSTARERDLLEDILSMLERPRAPADYDYAQ